MYRNTTPIRVYDEMNPPTANMEREVARAGRRGSEKAIENI